MTELDNLFIKFGHKLPVQTLERLIDEVDHDNSGEIEFNEFLLVMKKLKDGKIGGLGNVFGNALAHGNISGAASALREAMFGTSKKDKMDRRAMEKARDQQRREEAYKKREKEFRRWHIVMLKLNLVHERIAFKRDRSYILHNWVKTLDKVRC